jgi:dGTPase
MGAGLVGFSQALRAEEATLRRFLMQRMYRHWKVNRSRSVAKRILKDLFGLFLAEPETLPPGWRPADDDVMRTARRVCDYIAGMTDDYAIDEHRRLYSLERG